MKIHTVLILAGGDGDRFFPLQDKVQFKFIGKTILEHIVSSVLELAENIVVVTSTANENMLRTDLSKYNIHFVVQKSDLGGMADAVLAAKELLPRDVLILNANDIFDFSILKKSIEKTHEEKSMVGIIAKRMDSYFPGGYVRFEGDKVVEIIEKPDPKNCPSEYVNFVADYIIDAPEFVGKIDKLVSSDDQFEKALSLLMKKKPASCTKYEGDWSTLKYSWHVLSMQEYFFKNHLKKSQDVSVTVHKTAYIEGEVFLGKNVLVGAYSKITGPCFIGDNVIIGDHSLIRNSTIEQNSLVGSGCEVARSYLAEGVMLHRNYVGDSVLSSKVSMGAGAVTANYRFDKKSVQTPVKGKMIDTQKNKLGLIAGKEVKIGVNASTYPGVKLSAQTQILPGEIVKKDR